MTERVKNTKPLWGITPAILQGLRTSWPPYQGIS